MKKILLLLMLLITVLFSGCSSSDNSEPFIKGISDVANKNESENNREENRKSEIVEQQNPFRIQNPQ